MRQSQIAMHLGIGYAKRPEFGKDPHRDKEMLRSLEGISDYLTKLMHGRGEECLDIIEVFALRAEDKHSRSTSYCQELLHTIIKEFSHV